ncbi:MAG: redoxin domain-containing protein [Oscillatoria princeps RMCB-10]|jgi:peroxiredoxin/predicted 2-oxoglutarate/Fe(II)-dependent dioxygenase YbiX|nr:redoxin domain-containing protein [Oscillatoria princeps RMCB-10]
MAALEVGDFAPWFTLPSTVSPVFQFDTVAGRRIVLFFFGSAGSEQIQIILRSFQGMQEEFSGLGVTLFGVSIDRKDQAQNRPSEIAPSLTLFWDFDRAVSTKYGVCQEREAGLEYWPQTFVLNENLQIAGIFVLEEPAEHAERVLRFVQALPAPEQTRLATAHAPVLLIPNVLEKAFCQSLIELYRCHGGESSGFMRQVGEKTVLVLDDSFKKRRDFLIQDLQLYQKLNSYIIRRVRPEIEKAFQFTVTRVERYVVACYDAQTGGYFTAHRDNTTAGTAHRRFAMTLNLNVGEYSGGYLMFPEYAPHAYRPDTGTAIIFSCSLLHEVTLVTSGERFALLSFFYGEEDAKVREANSHSVVTDLSPNLAE